VRARAAAAAGLLPVACAVLLAHAACSAPAPSSPDSTSAYGEALATLAMLEDTRCPDGMQVAAYLQDAFPAVVRERAARALARLQDSTGVEGLADRLSRDPSVEVRREAAFALGEIARPSGYSPLARALRDDPDLEVRALALEALGKLADRQATGDCVRHLVDREPRLRREAAIALWRLADSTAAAPLTKVLDDRDPEVRAMAAWALEKTVMPRLVVPGLSALAYDNSWLVRAYAARTLGRQGAPEGVGPLLELTRDGDVHVRVNACRALGQLADSTAVPQLSAALDDPNPYVRDVAATALGKLRDLDVVPRLVGASRDPEPEVRAAAAGALGELEGPADSARAWAMLAPLTADPDVHVRAQTYAALGQVRSPMALSMLQRCLSGESINGRQPGPLERASAAAALARLHDTTALPALLAALDGRDAGLVSSVVDALGDLRAPDAGVAEAIVAAARANASPNEPDVVISALEALAKLKSPAGAPLAEEQLSSSQARVRDAARALLVVLRGDSAAAEAARAHGPPPWKPAPLTAYRTPPATAGSAVIHTSRGDIALQLFPEDAPRTVANFVALARKGYYDHLTFHRVVPNFVIQDGDPTGTGWGGPGYAIRCEYNRRRYGYGTLGMALSGKDTGGSQYFITHTPQPHLDGRYTVFGQVTKGLEVVESITLGDEIQGVTIGP
jgi:cyclophilin family peptidyl-prolyl cis-trans isomerase/HEAT repeat protein